MSDFVSWCRHSFDSPTIPLHFIEMIFPLGPLIFHFGANNTAQDVDFTHVHERADNAPFYARTCTRACLWRRPVSRPVKSPTIYRRNLRREKNDRLVSVHTSIDYGTVWGKNQRRGLFR